MSTYTLTASAAKAIGMLLSAGSGSETLLLHRPANDLCAQLHLEPNGRTITAVILLGSQRNTLTLQDGDSTNQLNLADYIEAIANGTAETAETGLPAVSAPLLPCCKCGSEAIAFDYADPRQTGAGPTRFINGVKCRHGECCVTREHATEQQAAATWNAIQSEPLADDHTEATLDMVNHPPHYNGHPSGLECIDVTELLPFNLGNAFKYVFRHRAKNGREDLEKARWYLTREQERCERGGISIGNLQATHALAGRIAVHEPYPVGAALVAIAADEPAEALHWIEHLLAA